MTAHPSLAEAKKAARIRRVIEEVMSRRAGGQVLTDDQIKADHPDLLPELAGELEALAVLERAWTISKTRSVRSAAKAAERVGVPLAPDAFEGYELSGVVHRGGQGVVYEAIQKSTGRRVAIKVMREGLFAGDADAARFEREVRILGQIQHPGVVGILASGVHAGHFFYVMEWVSGLPLDLYAAGKCPSNADRLHVFVRICEAVSAAHLRGIIHRDLKPANILVDERGQPRILDFGLARVVSEWGASQATTPGQFIGSMPWASPEQAAGDPLKIDQRTDVYSIGVMLYQALAGRFPYRVEGGPRDVLDQILTAAPSRLRTGSRDEEDLEAVVFKCLAKERERRYQSAAELAADLRRILDHRPVLARAPSLTYQLRSFVRRNKVLVAGVAAVAGALVLGLIGTSLGLIEASADRRSAENALRESQRLAYAASIAAADSGLRAGDAGVARSRLAAAPAALRDWEWRYLSARTDQSAAVLPLSPAHHALVSPDARSIAVLSRDGALRVLDAVTLAPRWEASIPQEARAHTEQRVACFSPDGTLVATTHGTRVLVWRIGAERPLADIAFPGPWGFVMAAIHPSNTRIALSGREARAVIHDLATGARIRELPATRSYSGLEYLPDGRTLAIISNEGPVLFDDAAADPVPPPVHRADVPGSFWPLRVSPDGSLVAASCGNEIVVVSTAERALRFTLTGHTQSVTALAFSPDGSRLASVGWDRAVRLWDLRTGAQIGVFIGHTGTPHGIGFVGAGTKLITASLDGTIRLWDPQTPDIPRVQMASVVLGLSFSGDGSSLLASSLSNPRLLDLSGPAPVESMRHDETPLKDAHMAAISPDGRVIAVAQRDYSIALWDRARREFLWTACDHTSVTKTLAFSPDGALVASCCDDQTLRLWRTDTGAPTGVFRHNASAGYPVAFSPDGRLLAGTSTDGVMVWECASGKTRAFLPNPPAPVVFLAMAFSPDGRIMATGDSSGFITIWDTASYQPIRTIGGMHPAVWSLAFNPAGNRLAAGSQDRTVRIFDPLTGDELLILRGHQGSVMSLAWSPDGRTLASGSFDFSLRLWSAPAAAPPGP